MRGLPLLTLLACALPLAGCAQRFVPTDRGPQAYYQTGYPVRDVSGELERIMTAMKRLQVTGTYRTWRFRLSDSIRVADVRQRRAFPRAIENYTFDHSKTGSAVVVGLGAGRATLVTAEHVVALPDTIVVYFRDRTETGPVGTQTPFIESLSILSSSSYWLLGPPEIRPFTILAADTARDVAAIAVDLPLTTGGISVLPIPAGDPARLAWGSFVYVLGYPRGFQMVTRGIVSDPDRNADHGFLLDGLFNRGISGGLIVAVRGETNALEWVGLATSASADIDYRLTPERRTIDEEALLVPYEGRLYLERLSRIDYGITFSVPASAVLRLLERLHVPVTVSGARAP
jgi:S1-C subfamily serine protease